MAGAYSGTLARWASKASCRSGSARATEAVLIPKESFERITKKIVRGIYFIEDSIYIQPPYKIDFFALPEDGNPLWKDALDRFGSVYAREPGVVVRRAVAHDDHMSSLFEITFWKQFRTYASVTKIGM